MRKYITKIICLRLIKSLAFMFIFCSISLAAENTYQGAIFRPSHSGDTEEVVLNPKYFGKQNFTLSSDENPEIITLDDFSKYYHSYTTVLNFPLIQ